MKHIYKLNVKSEEAKRVREDIREHKLKRKLFKSIEPSVKLKRALEDYNRDNDLLFEGRSKQINLDS